MSIEGGDQHSTADAITSPHDPIIHLVKTEYDLS